MHRESVYTCAYLADDVEYVAHVRAWDAREAAELFARELELECLECDGGGCVEIDDICVCPVEARALGAIAS